MFSEYVLNDPHFNTYYNTIVCITVYTFEKVIWLSKSSYKFFFPSHVMHTDSYMIRIVNNS